MLKCKIHDLISFEFLDSSYRYSSRNSFFVKFEQATHARVELV